MPQSPQLILGSTSKYRRELLGRLGVPFTVEAPKFDENSLKGQIPDPKTLAETLAFEKAKSLRRPGVCIIGSDQVAALGTQVLGKPGTPEKALQSLQTLRGRSHQLFTAVCLILDEQVLRFTDVTSLQMRDLSDENLKRYIQEDQPLDCAGSYKIEQRGIRLFESLQTEDFTAIQGLPLLKLTRSLKQLGFKV